MKLTALILLSFLSGCAIIGTNWIHSPNSDTGEPWKLNHVHGGATKKAPPDTWIFSLDDTTHIAIKAQTISEKENFAGIFLPIFPVFWLKKTEYYEQVEELRINITASAISETDLLIDSIRLTANNQTFRIASSNAIELDMLSPWYFYDSNSNSIDMSFPISGETIEEFQLSNILIIRSNTLEKLPSITFKKMKQRWTFLGPLRN